MIALTHIPSHRLQAGERSFIDHEPIDYDKALRQHAEYRQTLVECGWDVRTLLHHADLPDATFIEDTAIVLDELAVLAPMGTASRRVEPAALEPILSAWRNVRRIELPAKLEGGDVLRVGRTLLVGRSSRTNAAGIAALTRIVEPLGYRVVSVEVTGCLHLKTAVCALPDGRLLINPACTSHADLSDFTCVAIPESEPFSGNILLSDSTIIMPAAHVETAALLRRDFDVRTVDLSEFAKAEGGVTCLSLLIH